MVEVVDEDETMMKSEWVLPLAAPNTVDGGERVSGIISPSEGMAEDTYNGILMDCTQPKVGLQ